MSEYGGDLHAGRKLGRYELLVPLAQGATADVWAARMTGATIEKIVAVKAMSTELGADADADAESMFLDEARIVSRIRHPNVGTVIELGDADDVLFIVMDWIEGEPLQVVMREAKARMPMPIALRIVKQAAAGLHAAHELCNDEGKPVGLVHRDVSPQNILVGYDGVVRVIDFGVAKAESNLQRTSVGQIKGKVPYMAPEQAMGDRVDRRTDIFALGVVLYQLVTGKHPFRGDNEFATLARIRDKNPAEPPRSHVPDLPAALEEAMLTALAKKREERFATMHDFARALDKAVPSPPDGDSVLGAYLSELCSPRAAKREQAIRDALREHTGKDTRPVNLGIRPVFQEGSSGIRSVRALLGGKAPSTAGGRSEPAAAPRGDAPDARVRTGSSGSHGMPAAASSATFDLPPGMRPQRGRATLIAAGIVIVLVLLLGIIAASGGSHGADDEPVKHAF